MATEILRPNGVGDYTNLTPLPGEGEANWEDVDEAVADDDGTIVYTASVTQLKDAYNLEATSIPAGSTINSVKVYFRVYRSAAGGSGFHQPFLRLGTEETAGTEIEETQGWGTYNEILSRPGGGSWGVSDLNSLQGVIGSRDPAGVAVFCTQVYVEIDYTEVTYIPPRGFYQNILAH